MDRARLKRVEKLVEMRQAAADVARGAFADARRAAERAHEGHEAGRAAWAARAEEIAGARYRDIDELVAARAHLETLRLREAALARAAAAADAVEATRREECLSAERELSKLERWRASLLDQERAEEARRERLQTDEIAARTFARRLG
jgi:hypothetical protein